MTAGSRARHILVTALVVVLGSCVAGPPTPRAVIETAAGTTTFRLEIADTDALRVQGLMRREHLAEDAGMVFLWDQDTTSAFHMRDTQIPLTVAFFAADGRILRTIDMTPCPTDPCPAYDPGLAYRGALEVNAGALGRKGVRVGDRIRIER